VISDGNKGGTFFKKIPLIVLVPIEIIVLNVLMGSAILISMHLSWLLANINTVILGLVIIGIAFIYRQFSFTWLALIAVIGGIIGGMYGLEYQDIKGREFIRGISLADAVKKPEAGGYYFTEGKVRSEYTATFIRRTRDQKGRTTTTFFYAAPVTEANWTPQQEVMVWAVCGPGDNTKDWEKPFKAGIRARKMEREEFRKVVRLAIDQYGLMSHPDAILIHWVPSPDSAAQDYLGKILEAVLIWNVIWLVGLIGVRIYLFFKRKKKPVHPKQIKENAESSKDSVSGRVLIRIIFTVWCFIALEFALFLSRMKFSSFISIMGLMVGLVFFIIASVSLQVAHHKDKRPFTDLFWFLLFPFIAYGVIFFSFDFSSKLFWIFPGYFYFLSITGGFVFGILLSPFIAARDNIPKRRIKQIVREGFVYLKSHGLRSAAGIMFSAILTVLVYYYWYMLSHFVELSLFQTVIFYVFQFAAILAVIRFTYRHTKFNISKDYRLKKKYGYRDKD